LLESLLTLRTEAGECEMTGVAEDLLPGEFGETVRVLTAAGRFTGTLFSIL
jgi:hypothetical protein